mmetsp:Transcript_53898/g.124062  ORF Transcript_53898/g.124062 Transcript_53898/m.124062 type:complete len:234 (-) Transcript_53898:192-893(-)
MRHLALSVRRNGYPHHYALPVQAEWRLDGLRRRTCRSDNRMGRPRGRKRRLRDRMGGRERAARRAALGGRGQGGDGEPQAAAAARAARRATRAQERRGGVGRRAGWHAGSLLVRGARDGAAAHDRAGPLGPDRRRGRGGCVLGGDAAARGARGGAAPTHMCAHWRVVISVCLMCAFWLAHLPVCARIGVRNRLSHSLCAFSWRACVHIGVSLLGTQIGPNAAPSDTQEATTCQ